MAYQPNDFVNPNQRDVELPAGCKDLNEMLQKVRAQKQATRPIYPPETGSLKDVPRHVQRLFAEHYGASLGVTIRPAETILWVQNRYPSPALSFLLREGDMTLPVIQDYSDITHFTKKPGGGN